MEQDFGKLNGIIFAHALHEAEVFEGKLKTGGMK